MQAVKEGLGKVLEAVGTTTVVIGLLQQHHIKVIQPHVAASTGDASACNSGLTALIKATEERVLTALQAALNAFLAQVTPTHHVNPCSPCCLLVSTFVIAFCCWKLRLLSACAV